MASGTSAADLLSAASLLLAALAVLYGVWYASIDAARNAKFPTHAEDAKQDLDKVCEVFMHRAIPLLIASALATLVFASDAVRILEDTMDAFEADGLHAFDYYNSVEAAFVLVVLGSGFLACHIGKLSWDLRTKYQAGASLPSATDTNA